MPNYKDRYEQLRYDVTTATSQANNTFRVASERDKLVRVTYGDVKLAVMSIMRCDITEPEFKVDYFCPDQTEVSNMDSGLLTSAIRLYIRKSSTQIVALYEAMKAMEAEMVLLEKTIHDMKVSIQPVNTRNNRSEDVLGVGVEDIDLENQLVSWVTRQHLPDTKVPSILFPGSNLDTIVKEMKQEQSSVLAALN